MEKLCGQNGRVDASMGTAGADFVGFFRPKMEHLCGHFHFQFGMLVEH